MEMISCVKRWNDELKEFSLRRPFPQNPQTAIDLQRIYEGQRRARRESLTQVDVRS